MKALFCHDGPIEKRNNNEFFGIGFNDELFKRYKIISDEVNIAMRVHKNEDINFDKNKFLKLSSEYKVIECPNISSLKGQLLKKKNCYKILDEAIKKNDLIIIRLPSFIGNMAVDIAKKNNKPYLIELVGCPWDALWNRSLLGKIVAPILYFKTKRRVKKAPYVIYVTNNFLQKRYPTNGKSIGCSDVFLTSLKSTHKSFTKEKKIILGTLGSIDVKYKGQEYVIKAIPLLKNEGYNIEYQIAGSGNKKRLGKIAKYKGVDNNVKFIGTIKHDDVFKWLDDIDIYIQPSTTEGMPRALIEAMSRGCFCMGSNVGGIPELLNNNVCFKKRNSKEIANIIRNITIKNFINESKKNIKNASKFKLENLNKIRDDFYREFLKEVANE